MLLSALALVAPHTFAAVGDHFEFDGKPFAIHSGEIHYPRIPEACWRDRLRAAKAMGLNTVCTYAFWNLHEPRPGEWDFKGNLNVAKFVKIAGEEGLKVIVRPGPYICTELDFGGLPAWTLKDRTMRVRSKDPKFMALTQAYFTRLGKELKPLLLQNGGPIIMTQVENEYGSYGNDHVYMAGVRDALLKAGFKGQLFTSDGPSQNLLGGGALPGLPATINFGGGAPGAFAELAKFRPGSPRMIGEYWAGWFDQWGKRHQRSSVANNLKDLEWCLQNGVSFNLYMFHGGTNWAFMPGSNGGANTYDLDVTSYDYDSALDESGRVTPKYVAFRDLMQKYSPAPLPPAPTAPKPIKVAMVHLTESQPLLPLEKAGRFNPEPKSFEDLDQAYGMIRYEASVPTAGKQTLSVGRLMDYATVYVDGVLQGTMDRRLNQKTIAIDVPRANAIVSVLVEAHSRVNFGGALPDERKGLEGPIRLGDAELKGWSHFQYPLAEPPKTGYASVPGAISGPVFFRGTLQVPTPGDTFLDTRGFNKGYVWVNGRNLGRFWKIGPQQTLFLPGVWLKKGANEVVVLDEGPLGSVVPTIQGLDVPILDAIQRAPTAGRNRTKDQNVEFAGAAPVASGEWPDGAAPQTAPFKGRGRYLGLEVVSEHGEGTYASLAELWAVGADGKDLPRQDWKVAYADSEELDAENGSANNVFDLQPTTFWHSNYSDGAAPLPHRIVIDLGRVVDLSGIRVLPRQEGENGRIKGYRVFLSETPFKGQ